MKACHILLAVAALLLASSCKTEKSPMQYFMDIDEITSPIPLGDYSVKIEPGDELYITVTSSNPEATALYNFPATNPATRSDIAGVTNPRQQTFIVDPEGNIEYPQLGKIHVQGMTVEQLRDYITNSIKKDVADPVVIVQIVYYRVSVMGEVNRPGYLYVSSPRYSILDALAQAGDLTQYGERNNILLIREEDGERKFVRINLNSADILSSPYFYLKQNDYIYVEPNNIRKDNSEYNTFNQFRLQVVSTIVTASVSVISLIIALTR